MLQAGIDEVGLGPCAGPVVAAGVIIETGIVQGVRDSKLISEPERERLAELIRKAAKFVVVKRISVDTINRRGMRKSWEEAVTGCVIELRRCWGSMIQIDGTQIPRNLPKHAGDVRAIIHGDDNVYAISAASIVAKVARDAEMIELHKKYPHYDWEQNKGYGTPKHIAALRQHGTCPEHRLQAAAKLIKGGGGGKAEIPVDDKRAFSLLSEVVDVISDDVDVGDFEKSFALNNLSKLRQGGSLTPKLMFYVVKVHKAAMRRARIAKGTNTPEDLTEEAADARS